MTESYLQESRRVCSSRLDQLRFAPIIRVLPAVNAEQKYVSTLSNSSSEDNSNSSLRVPNMQPREQVATCHCPPRPSTRVGQEEIPRLSGSHLPMRCEAAVKIAVQPCDRNYINPYT